MTLLLKKTLKKNVKRPFIPIKKAAQEKCLLTRRYSRISFNSFYRVPDFLLPCFKWAVIGINLNAEFALETVWHSPRVPAYTASAEGKLAVCQFLT